MIIWRPDQGDTILISPNDSASPSRRLARASRGWLLGWLALTLLIAGPARSARYAKGEIVVVSGIVTDAEGQPLPGVEVVLAGHRRQFDVWNLTWRERGESELSAITDEQGSYSIRWRWDPFYNRFEVAAGIRQRVGGESTWWEVSNTDLTRSMKLGSPVVANLTVERAAEVRDLQAFVASLDSTDAKRVYQELGKPDKVREIQLSRQVEITWWYFDRGMLYRFVDGRLASSESFEPIEPDSPRSPR